MAITRNKLLVSVVTVVVGLAGASAGLPSGADQSQVPDCMRYLFQHARTDATTRVDRTYKACVPDPVAQTLDLHQRCMCIAANAPLDPI